MEDMTCTKVCDMAVDDRPREKLINHGPKSMTNSELLSLIICSGMKGTNALELARQILNKYDNKVDALIKADIDELKQFKGIGTVKATKIVAAVELAMRGINGQSETSMRLMLSRDVFKIMQPLIGFAHFEQFWVLYLNRGLVLLRKEKISEGTISATLVDTRKIIKKAIEILSTSIIVCHNHPSGLTGPSNEDIELTKKISAGCKYFDIQLVDHIIISNHGFFSFSDENLLP